MIFLSVTHHMRLEDSVLKNADPNCEPFFNIPLKFIRFFLLSFVEEEKYEQNRTRNFHARTYRHFDCLEQGLCGGVYEDLPGPACESWLRRVVTSHRRSLRIPAPHRNAPAHRTAHSAFL